MSLIETAKNYVMSRRAFLGRSATLAVGTAVAVTIPGCGLQKVSADKTAELMGKEGEWISAACWHNCGGRCLNKAYVVDGVVTKQKTDDTHTDSPDFPQQRGCARGRSQRKQVLGVDRLKYPMKRKNWEPGGGKKELRGKDEWVRISWDEALGIVASEINRVKAAYGNSSIFIPTGGEMPRVLSSYGGYAERWGQVSWGAWPEVNPRITGIMGTGTDVGNDRFRLKKSKLIILWGANPAMSSQGTPSYNFLQAKKAGVKFIVIDPIYTESARVFADQWIPVRPATDTALILGMSHYIITNNLHDQSFLDTYCSGFDAAQMPEGAKSTESFKDYVLGTMDNKPKTPEWAAEICGVDAETIKQLAKEYATSKPAAIITGGAPARINNGEHLPHAMMTLGFLTGNYGVPGAGVSPNMHNSSTNAGPMLVKAGAAGVAGIKNPLTKIKINNGDMWNAILNGKYIESKDVIKDINIQMIMHGFGSVMNQRCGTIKGIEAHRKVEFVVTQNLFLNTDARYSDVVLPVVSQWEVPGSLISGNREILIYYRKVIAPLFEAKTDIWIAAEVAKRLGLDPNVINPVSAEQQLFNSIAGATVIKPDGSGYEKLVTLTEQDITELGATGAPQMGRIAYQEFKEKGIYQVPRTPGDKLEFTSFEDFIKDPVAKKVATPSGKFEIYSEPLSQAIEKVGFSTKDALPKYEPSVDGYEDGLKDGYEYQLVTPHFFRRSHSTLDNVPWLREAFKQQVWINASDAAALGIKNNDIVKITSRDGAVIRPALVTERIMPKVVAIPQGAWVELDESTGIDKAGCTNILSRALPTGQGHTGYNSNNVKIEKSNLKLDSDEKWPQRIVF